jgi:hypothetical protein
MPGVLACASSLGRRRISSVRRGEGSKNDRRRPVIDRYASGKMLRAAEWARPTGERARRVLSRNVTDFAAVVEGSTSK